MDRRPGESGDSGQGSGNRPTKGSSTSDTAGLAGMGVQFLVAILLFLFLGKWLDARLGTAPWLGNAAEGIESCSVRTEIGSSAWPM